MTDSIPDSVGGSSTMTDPRIKNVDDPRSMFVIVGVHEGII